MTFSVCETNSINFTDDVALSSTLPDTPSLMRHLADLPPITPDLSNDCFNFDAAVETMARSINDLA